jgi:hypothetical protein
MTTPPPVYNPNVPLPKENLAESQDDFLINFSTIYEAFSRNHVPLDDLVEPGNHSYIELFKSNQASQTDIGEISVYIKTVEGTTEQVFFKYPNGTEIQFSCYQIYSLPAVPSQTQFFTFLPGKVIVYFGLLNTFALPAGTPPALYFAPFVSKNIITVNFCPQGGIPTIIPWVKLETPQNGFIRAAFLDQIPAGRLFYYIAMGNI